MDQVRPGSSRGNAYDKELQLPRYMEQRTPQGYSKDSATRTRPASAAVQARGSRANSTRVAAGGGRTSATRTRTATGGAKGASGGKPAKGTSGAGSGNNKRKRRPTKAQRLMRLAVAAFAVLLVAVAAILLISRNTGEKEPTMLDLMNSGDRFYEGIKIQGVDVGGMTAEEAKPQVERAVNALLGGVSLTLQHGENSWAFTAADIGAGTDVDALLIEAMTCVKEGSLTENAKMKEEIRENGKAFDVNIEVDTGSIIDKLEQIAVEANEAAVEPHAIPTLSEGNVQHFEYVEGVRGKALDAQKTAALIETRIQEKDYQAVLSPVFNDVEPTMTMDFIKEHTQFIATCSTEYSRSSSDELTINRCFNIEKAANIINLNVVQNGERWSFNDVVGPRTKATGWKEAKGISGGKEFTRQYGGGICQVSTTLYGALLAGNILIPEGGRTKHSIPSTYVDKGLDATVDTSGIDLFFENDTGAPLYIFAYIKKHESSSRKLVITVSLYGKALPAGVTYKAHSEIKDPVDRTNPNYVDDPLLPLGYQMEVIEMRPQYTADVYLDKLVDGQVVETKFLYTDKYRGNDATINVGTGDRSKFTSVPETAVLMPGYDPLPVPGSQIPEESENE